MDEEKTDEKRILRYAIIKYPTLEELLDKKFEIISGLKEKKEDVDDLYKKIEENMRRDMQIAELELMHIPVERVHDEEKSGEVYLMVGKNGFLRKIDYEGLRKYASFAEQPSIFGHPELYKGTEFYRLNSINLFGPLIKRHKKEGEGKNYSP